MSCDCPLCNAERYEAELQLAKAEAEMGDQRENEIDDRMITIAKIRADLARETARADSAVKAQAELMRENERLRDALKELEWCDDRGYFCPVCGNDKLSNTHYPDCWLSAILMEKK